MPTTTRWARNGNDQLQGGAGADLMGGGVGADRFYYDQASVDGSMDTIQIFKQSEGDRVVLSAVDANIMAGGDQAFSFIGAAAFNVTAGGLRLFVDASGAGRRRGDVNGDGVADFAVLFQNTAHRSPRSTSFSSACLALRRKAGAPHFHWPAGDAGAGRKPEPGGVPRPWPAHRLISARNIAIWWPGLEWVGLPMKLRPRLPKRDQNRTVASGS